MLRWIKKDSLNKCRVPNKRQLSRDPKKGEKADRAKKVGKRILGVRDRK